MDSMPGISSGNLLATMNAMNAMSAVPTAGLWSRGSVHDSMQIMPPVLPGQSIPEENMTKSSGGVMSGGQSLPANWPVMSGEHHMAPYAAAEGATIQTCSSFGNGGWPIDVAGSDSLCGWQTGRADPTTSWVDMNNVYSTHPMAVPSDHWQPGSEVETTHHGWPLESTAAATMPLVSDNSTTIDADKGCEDRTKGAGGSARARVPLEQPRHPDEHEKDQHEA